MRVCTTKFDFEIRKIDIYILGAKSKQFGSNRVGSNRVRLLYMSDGFGNEVYDILIVLSFFNIVKF